MRRHCVILCAALVVACGEPLSPNEVAGTYALQRVAGDTLPTVLFENDYETVRVLADTLLFKSDGRGARVSMLASAPVGGPPEDPVRGEHAFSYRINDGRIEVGFDCPINADCVGPPHLVLWRTANGLRSDFALGDRIPLTYIRVASAP